MKLPKLPKEIGYDVCGYGHPERFFITHEHRDHLPARFDIRALCAPPLVQKLRRRYLGRVEPEEYTDTFKTSHKLFDKRGKIVEIETYGYFIGEIAIIPEATNALELLKEYAPKYPIIVLFRQPREHPLYGAKRSPHADEVNCYFADPTSWEPYAPNVVPKCTESIQDVRDNPDIFWRSPFSKL